jgi:hypothetical protein
MQYPIRVGAIATSVVLVCLGAVMTTVNGADAAIARTVGRCHTSQVAASLIPESPAAGQRFATLVLTNRSQRACGIFGYEGLQLLDRRLGPLPTHLIRRDLDARRNLVMRPGRSASALLHWTVVPSSDEPVTRPCEPTPALVRVTPPNEFRSLIIPWRLGPVCGHGRVDTRPLLLSIPPIPACRTNVLTAHVTGPLGAAGTFTFQLVFRNIGSVPCSMGGFPGVSFVDKVGKQIGAAVARQHSFGGTVIVPPGGELGASLATHSTDSAPSDCKPASASGLRVFPPDQTVSLIVPQRRGFPVCSNPAVTDMASISEVTSLANLT